MAARKPKCKTKCCAATPLKRDGVSDGELLARLAKALGHPARVTILQMLIDERRRLGQPHTGRLAIQANGVELTSGTQDGVNARSRFVRKRIGHGVIFHNVGSRAKRLPNN